MAKKENRNNIPLKFLWGVFCRQILTGANDPNDLSLIGLMPRLNLEFAPIGEAKAKEKGKATDEGKEQLEFPCIFWVHALFEVVVVNENPTAVGMSAMISQTHRENKAIIPLEFNVKPGDFYASLNLQIAMNTPGSNLLLKPGTQELKVSFRHESTDLGKIVLPINVIFKKAEAPKEASSG